MISSWITDLNRSESITLLLVIALGCVALLVTAVKFHRQYRFMTATATSRVRSAAQGYVELKGLGEWLKGDLIKSPFSASRCIWYHCRTEKKKKSGRKISWINISDEVSDELFCLVDETGTCIIDPEGAHVLEESKDIWYGSIENDCYHKPRAKNPLWSIFQTGDYRFSERLIRPATPIYAIGEFRSHDPIPQSQTVTRLTKELLREWKLKPGKYLTRFDKDSNNKIDENEWKTIEKAARNEVLDQFRQENRQQHLMSRPTISKDPFIISAVEEERLVFTRKLLSALSFIGAFILIVLFVVIWNLQL